MPSNGGHHERATPPAGIEEFPTLARPEERVTGGGVAPGPQLQPLQARYDLLEELGRGGMGVVLRARDRETDEIVALKVLKAEIAAQAEHVERFKAELRLARRITHKNVCRVYELLRFGETAVIAMEYVEGDSLRAVLRRFGTAPLRRGLDWARQIAAALGEAHAQGIVHRDLKPENVIIDSDGHARVLDFGIARSLDIQQTQMGSLIGTPAYMSPEQAQGKSADARSDVYSLGLLLYEMFTGRTVFHGDTAVSVVRKHIDERPEPPRTVEPFIPPFLERVILRCLEKDPAKRYASMAELLSDLEGKEAAEPTPSAGVPEHLGVARRSDVLLLLAGATGLATFLALAPLVQPEYGLRLRATSSMFAGQARDEVKRRGWTPSSDPVTTLERSTDVYTFLAQREGAVVARERMTREFPPYFARVVFRTDQATATLQYELDGSMRSAQLPVVGWVPVGEGLPRADALAAARADLQRVYGLASSDLELEYDGPLTPVEGRHGHRFQWVRRDPTGIARRHQVDVFDRVTSVQRLTALPESYRPPRTPMASPLLIVGWLAIPLALFLARRVFSRVRLRETLSLAAVSFLWSIGIGIQTVQASDSVALFFVVVPIMSIAMAASLIVTSSTTEYLAERRWPQVTAGYSALLRWRPHPPALGLALVRGAAVGLALLAVQAGLQWLGVTAKLSWPRLPQRDTSQILSALLPLSIPAGAVLQALFTTLLIAFTLLLVRRWVSSTPVMVVLTAGVLTLGAFANPGAVWFEFVQALVLWSCFAYLAVRFDLLTLFVATLTLDLWTRFFVVTQVLSPVGAGSVWVVFVLWGLLVLWGAYGGFRPFWQRLAGRLGRSFD